MISSAGVFLALLAGVLNGSFAAPTKYTTRWKWENVWAIWAVVAFFIVPWTLALLTIPHLPAVYSSADSRSLVTVIAFGAGYGIAALCFGLGVEAIGIALNFAIALGLSTAIGSLLPLVWFHPDQVFAPTGLKIEGGIAVILLGIVVCAIAGKMKERQQQQLTTAPRSRFGIGLAFAIIAGLGSPFVNFGLAFGDQLSAAARAQGAAPANAANVIWPLLLNATLVPYLIYCIHLWRKNNSFKLYSLPGTGFYWPLGFLMGALWMGSIALYGTASASMASMGTVLGWPLFNSAIILTSNIWGFATGEWRGAPQSTALTMWGGMLLLIAGFCILALSLGSS